VNGFGKSVVAVLQVGNPDEFSDGIRILISPVAGRSLDVEPLDDCRQFMVAFGRV
jgi:hypothetical protein